MTCEGAKNYQKKYPVFFKLVLVGSEFSSGNPENLAVKFFKFKLSELQKLSQGNESVILSFVRVVMFQPGN